ncbi:recombinase family protein [Clostridium sp. D2Q-11]|uniref:Recombinase family protein n=1 Tax=Anaeromonas frigoriresistens TaxID=2683708 RepID=A0A942UVC6_9FIRM|nr:recombinase family protein [Anaeromonas frigoriresistens]MBS4538180.1 recombinase family protein [Anaeromonas frigoriresistens]
MYAMYLRKSRKDIEAESRGEGETLKRHERILLDLAKKMNIVVDKIYREVVSGETIRSRPIMQELLSDVEQGKWDGVLVVEVERLARGDTMDQGLVAQAFKYTNTKIITPMKTYDPNNEFDEEYFEFGLFMSRREYKTINRRLQQGRIQSVKEGKYLGSIAPYGYKRKKLESQKGYTLEPHSEQAKIVKLIFDLYTRSNRIGVQMIANRLNEMNIPTSRGGDWTTSTIQTIIRNPVYIGKIKWNTRPIKKQVVDGEIKKTRPRNNNIILVDGLHPGIVDEEIFNLAQRYLEENSTPPVPTRHKLKNPLVGIIVCGLCGRKMNRRPHKGDYPDTLMCIGPTCNNISSHLYLVEEKLIQALSTWLEKYKLELQLENNKSENIELEVIEKSISIIDNELETLNKQLNNLHDLLEQGVYSKDVFIKRSILIKDKIKNYKNDKQGLLSKIEIEKKRENNKEILIPKIENIIEVYDTLKDPADKNRLLKEILEKVEYTKIVNGRWHNNPDEFKLKLYLKLNK